MTAVLLPEPYKELPKPVKGAVFVIFWLIAIALWIVAPFMIDPHWGAFLIDSGIVFASVGFAAASMTGLHAFISTLIAGVVAIVLFALVGFGDVLALLYFLRMLVPFLALLVPLYATVGRVKVWYS